MEKIHSAALFYTDPDTGEFFEVHNCLNHAYCMSLAHEIYSIQVSRILMEQKNQGFYTTEGRFVDRKEAYKIAKAAGQLRHYLFGDNDENAWLDSYNVNLAMCEE